MPPLIHTLFPRTPQSQTAQRPSQTNDPTSTRSSSSGPIWAWIILALAALVILSAGFWFLYASWRARRLGLPQPSLNPFTRSGSSGGGTFSSSSRRRRGGAGGGRGIGGAVDWVKDKVSGLTGGGKGYQGPPGGRTRGQFGALADPDEAWDAVGAEADYGYSNGGGYEEQELGLRTGLSGGDGEAGVPGRGYAGHVGLSAIETGRDEGERERRAKEDLERRYDEEMHGGRGGRPQNPFGDEEEASLRGVSPRPEDEGRGHVRDGSGGGRFREDM